MTVEITSAEQLEAIVGLPTGLAVTKERSVLTDIDRAWLAATPFCVLATSDADGRCDASPKGDPPGRLVHVVDDATIALAERPGNRRVDGYRNVLANPYVGLDFLVPGRGDTLRVNGRARLLTDAPYLDALAVDGKRPVLVLEVQVETVFFHCAKAFLRSRLWDPESWDPQALPRRAVIAREVERASRTLEELDDYYRPDNYGKNLY
jgi:PPOX class probable FMN-dependent enzyme